MMILECSTIQHGIETSRTYWHTHMVPARFLWAPVKGDYYGKKIAQP